MCCHATCFSLRQKISRHTFEPLWKLTGLKDLRLVDNGFKKFPIQFLRFTALTNLVLRRNKLIELPDNMDEFPGLTGLHLEGNVLTELPPTFATLTNLTVCLTSRICVCVWFLESLSLFPPTSLVVCLR